MERTLMLDGQVHAVFDGLRRVVVRPVRREEEARWKALIRQHHYMGLDHLVGETILHVAEVDGHPFGPPQSASASASN